MHKIGDVVRLNRGWTPMIVLHIQDNGELWAVYASRHKYYSITREHYINWRHSYSYHRHHTQFSKWEKEPINTDWNYIMTRRYRFIKDPALTGVYMNTTSAGNLILEMDNGEVNIFAPHHLEEDIPNTFRVKSMSNSYTCHYQVPNSVDIKVNDVLISDSSNFYVVMEINTKNRNPKGIFKGRRVVTEVL